MPPLHFSLNEDEGEEGDETAKRLLTPNSQEDLEEVRDVARMRCVCECVRVVFFSIHGLHNPILIADDIEVYGIW